MSDQDQQAPSFISRAEHDVAMAAHRIALHRMAIVFLVVAAGVAWFSYAVYRDFRQSEAVHAAEKVAAVAGAASKAGVPPAAAAAQQVSTDVIALPRSMVDKLLNRPAQSSFLPRQQDAPKQAPPVKTTDAKTGNVTLVYCPPPGEATATATTDPKTGVVTTAYTCPTPPPIPNVTRLDPVSTKSGDAFVAKYREYETEPLLADYDVLGEILAQRTRGDQSFALLLPKGGGRIVGRRHVDPRPNLEWGHYFELYGTLFRQQTFNSQALTAPSIQGYGGALGINLDAFRYKEMHFQPYGEVSFVSPAVELRYGIRIPVCVGAVCP